MIYAADASTLLRARHQARDRELGCAAYVRAMFSTGHDEANREAFRSKPADTPDVVGLALHGPRKDVDRAVKGASLHP
jgi:hypothetical protein